MTALLTAAVLVLTAICALLVIVVVRLARAVDQLEQDRDIHAVTLGALTVEVQRHDDVLVEVVKLVDPAVTS